MNLKIEIELANKWLSHTLEPSIRFNKESLFDVVFFFCELN